MSVMTTADEIDKDLRTETLVRVADQLSRARNQIIDMTSLETINGMVPTSINAWTFS
jgi:hypothetical protein